MVSKRSPAFPLTTPYGYVSDQWTAPDGTRLVYHSVGEGPPIVISNGVGGTFFSLRYLYEHLAKRFRVVSWDYRCLHQSDNPSNLRAVSVADSVEDLKSLLDLLGIERALFIGWSMGVQVNFELFRTRPEAIVGIAAFNGTAGNAFAPMREALPTRLVVSGVLRTMAHWGNPLGRVARLATTTDHTVKLMRGIGLLAPTVDVELFHALARDYARLDFERYGTMLEALNDHSAWDLLPSIEVPTCVVVGDHDFMTPVRVGKRIDRLLPDNELTVLHGATHFAPVERPAVFNAAVDRLIERAGYPKG